MKTQRICGCLLLMVMASNRTSRECIESFRPCNAREHLTTVANVAEYLAGNLAFVSGQHLLITGGAPA
jgi:hypothetical protein